MEKAETTRHIQAFEFFYALGGGRTITAVSRRFGITEDTARSWSKKFKWDERVARRNRKVKDKLEKASINNVVQTRRKFAKDIKKAIDAYMKSVLSVLKANADGKKPASLLITDASDLEKMVKLYLLLEGEPTSKVARTNTNTNIDMNEQEIEDWLKNDTESQRLLTEAFRRKHGVAVSGQD